MFRILNLSNKKEKWLKTERMNLGLKIASPEELQILS